MSNDTAQSAMLLTPATQDDFDWLLGQREATRQVSVAPDLAPPEIIQILRGLPANWLMVVGGELVGIIGLKADNGGSVEIGYGVAESRQGLGFASAAVAALLPILRARDVQLVTAETADDNLASQRVLEHNAFLAVGERVDDEDGPLIMWERNLG